MGIWDALTGQGSTGPLTDEQKAAAAAAQQYAQQSAALGADPYAINQTNPNADRASQLQTIGMLKDAATGQAPSAAQLQLQQQSANNNAAAFGAAAALKGRTPGASFTTAARQNAQNQLQTNAAAGAQRAAEMAQARSALTEAGATQQQQDQQAAQAQAQLKTNYASNLEQGQLTSQGQGVTAAGDIVGANVKNSQSEAGSISHAMDAGGAALAAMSDRREKHDIHDADVKEAFEKVEPKTFRYDDPDAAGAAPGPRVGLMAQDLQKSPLGKEVVIDGKPLKLDIGNALGLALDGVAMLTKELEKLKKGKK